MKVLFITGFILFFISGCSSDITSTPGENYDKRRNASKVLYLNSFESDADTAGWNGLAPEMFVDDASPGGGSKSLYIGGGCVQPAGSFKMNVTEKGYYSISLWEKTADTGGGLNLIIDDKANQVVKYIPLTNKDWKYHNIDSIYFPENCTLSIELNVGGFVFASANIDELVIKKAE